VGFSRQIRDNVDQRRNNVFIYLFRSYVRLICVLCRVVDIIYKVVSKLRADMYLCRGPRKSELSGERSLARVELAPKHWERSAFRALHSMRMCFTVSIVLQVWHLGWDFWLSRYSWVRFVWPVLSLERTISHCRFLHDEFWKGVVKSLISLSLLLVVFFYSRFHWFLISFL
jgi:hypothetical protein